MKNLTLKFINVGYGEAILLQCPDSRFPGGMFTMLIDGGSADATEYADSSTGRITLGEYAAISSLDHIDLAVSTHSHEDHICGMIPLINKHSPSALWQTLPSNFYQHLRELDVSIAQNQSQDKLLHALNDYCRLCRIVEENGGEVRTISAGECFTLCQDLSCRILAPSQYKASELAQATRELYRETEEVAFLEKLNALDAKMNNYSLILLLEYCGTRILLPGDTNCAGYEGIDSESLQADIFKIGHHGQKDGISASLLDIMNPKAIVCCASSDRRYQSAYPELMQSILSKGIRLLFSDCPPVRGLVIPPHQVLAFTIGENGLFTAEYQ